MAVFSIARSADIRSAWRLSASSSRSRFTPDTEAHGTCPAHLKNVPLLTPCFRGRSATAKRLSGSLAIATIRAAPNPE
jgi:hypothetical protein